ncbi:restriction endonuclease subunit S [Cryobacterium sp. Hh38]|uniref:restriction endonuclease subunit S n=1 Tax=Cryobacterium sp. Hh38 TaxID=1259156 RepID=UPI002106765E|nr:restriction endonuclease subunit S [Cryobacterium sp. Hh38]
MRVPSDELNYLHNQRIGRVEVTDSTRVSIDYLEYLFRTNDFNHYLATTASGSKILHTAPSRIEAYQVELPPLEEQQRIAGVLGVLDDLIDTNAAVASGCERLARSIAATISDLVQLSRLAKAGVAKTVTPFGPVAHFSLPAFDSGPAPELVDGSTIKSAKLAFGQSMVLISRLNPHIPRIWTAYPVADKKNLASTEFVPLVGTDVTTEEVFAVASTTSFVEQMRMRVTGTTGSHQRVDKSALLDLKVPDVRRLSDDKRLLIRNLVSESEASRTMAAQLRLTRDELLPLLMSGKVRVGDVSQAGVLGEE